LDAVEAGKKAGMPITPSMIYGDDVSHVVTEEGIAYPTWQSRNDFQRVSRIAIIRRSTSPALSSDPPSPPWTKQLEIEVHPPPAVIDFGPFC
jgi:malonate decarboxylase alpha subunit